MTPLFMAITQRVTEQMFANMIAVNEFFLLPPLQFALTASPHSQQRAYHDRCRSFDTAWTSRCHSFETARAQRLTAAGHTKH